MRIAIAKYKSFENMPDWAKCCPETIKAMQPYHNTEEIIEVDNVIYMQYPCFYCGAPYGSGKAYRIFQTPRRAVSIDAVDIDEGSITEYDPRTDTESN